MPFVWSDYLRLAERLGVSHENEAAHRAAISRAYYAIFCSAKDRVLSLGHTIPTTGSSHVAVWDLYKKSRDRSARSVGDEGDRLRRFRTKADYRSGWAGATANVSSCLRRTKSALSRLNSLPGGVP